MGYKARILLPILLLGLSIRVFYLTAFYHGTNTDGDGYYKIAQNIAFYGRYSFDGNNPTAFRPPFYPLILTPFVYACTDSFIPIFLFQAIINTLTCYFIYILALRITRKEIALIAMILAVIYPFFIYYCGELLSEIWSVLVMTIFVYSLDLMFSELKRNNSKLKFSFLTGFIIGIGGLLKPSFLLTLPLLILFILLTESSSLVRLSRSFIKKEKKTRKNHLTMSRLSLITYHLSLLFLGTLIALSPWILRNWGAFGEIILTTTHGGYTFYEGNNSDFYYYAILNPDESGRWPAKDWLRWRETLFQSIQGLSEPEQSKILYNKGLDFIKNNPAKFFHATLVKFKWFISPVPRIDKPLFKLISICSYGVLIPFIIWGIVLSCRKDRQWLFYLILVAAITAVHSLYWSQMRYRLQVMPLLLIWAGIGIYDLSKRILPDRGV